MLRDCPYRPPKISLCSDGHLGRSKMPGLKMCDSKPTHHREGLFVLYIGRFAFIIPSPSTNEASHSRHMRQFELYTIITQRIALISIAACLASGRLCLFT